MDLWNFNVEWQDVSTHNEESYEAIIILPKKLEAYAIINIGRGPEFGGHSISIMDSEGFGEISLVEIHSSFDLPLEDQVVAAIAALIKWVQEALYQLELDELDPNHENYVR